ncbi:MAG: sulfatase-like hydrolase/transferase [bacterium]|nr:sulfatase-like hydrolase/transferase [bacterium]
MLAVLVLVGCDRRRPPNVLFVTIDTLRADRLGCYGFGLAITPAVDRLAREGVRCSDAITSAPITLPAHASMFTGLFPPAHGVRDNGNYALAPEAMTLAERLRDAGYATGAVVSAAVLAKRYGLDQGFDAYDDDLWAEDEPELFMIRERPAERTAARAVDWLERTSPDQPFFLWVHFFDPHQPYDVRAADLAAMAPTPYDAEIAQADRGLGTLIAWLEEHARLDDTLVVVTADHGESLGEHGEPTHGIFVYDATVHVPLVFRFPRALPAGRVYDGPTRHVDLMPTILGLLGLEPPAATQGLALGDALAGRIPAPTPVQYAEARLAEEGFGMAPLYAIRHGGRKWIRAPLPELYDLGADPKELRNLYPAEAAQSRPLDADLTALDEDSARLVAKLGLKATTHQIDAETADMLRALGYLAPPEQKAEMQGMDPKEGMALYAKLQQARQLAQLERWEATRHLLDEVLAASPQNVTARNLMALVDVRTGDLDGAERQYLSSLKQQPSQHRVVGALGAIALQRGDLDGAARRFDEALVLAPGFVEAMSNLGFVAAVRGDDAGAEQWYRRALEIDPSYPHVHRRLADLFYDRKDWPRAMANYRRVLELIPDSFAVLIQAGNTARFQNDPATAAAYYLQAARVRPDSWIPPYNLACLQALGGNVDEATAALEQAFATGFANPGLLEENEDLAPLRTLAAWPGFIERARAAEAAAATKRSPHVGG